MSRWVMFAIAKCWGRNSYGILGLGHTTNIGDNELPSSAAPIQFFP